MPLRDHFNPPLDDHHSWDALHAAWPTVIVMANQAKAARRVHRGPAPVNLGTVIEIDVASFEKEVPAPVPRIHRPGMAEPPPPYGPRRSPDLTWLPTCRVKISTKVHMYDANRDRRLVATVEIVSRSNKDRPSERRAFVGKCAALMRDGVSVAIVDLVTERHANLYAELIEFLGRMDPALPPDPPSIYAAACQWAPGSQTGPATDMGSPTRAGARPAGSPSLAVAEPRGATRIGADLRGGPFGGRASPPPSAVGIGRTACAARPLPPTGKSRTSGLPRRPQIR